MVMNIPAADLKRALKKLSPIKTESYQVHPSGVSAQDSDALVFESFPLDLGEPFSLFGKKFTQVVNRMSGQIEITRKEKSVVLKSAKARIELEIYSIKPLVLPDPAKYTINLEVEKFKKALSVASASASPAKSAAFGGVVMIQNLPLGIEEEISSGYRITGTDSIVLTVATVSTPVQYQFRSLLNLTAASIVQLMDGEILEIGDTNKCLILKSGTTTVYASMPVQKYPDFDKFLALPVTKKFSFNPEDFLSALKTVEPLIDETVDGGNVTVHFKDSVVQCSSVGGEGSDEAECEQLEPDPLFDPQDVKIRLNAKYLSGFLSKAKNPATLSLTSHPVKMESDGVVVLTMPVKEK